MALAAPAPAVLPTLYQHFTAGGIHNGLSTSQPYFTLNDKNITIYSGAMHYFRVPKPYWRDRLRKMRAAGLNTVETYVPWNLHEPQPGNFDFGNGTNDMSDFLDVKHFLEVAQEEDLLAIVRPGPYICSEWEFGGLPSWLLRDKEMKVRTSQPNYMQYVTRYFNMLLPILAMLQFTKGGPIIAVQIENEYGSTNQPGVFTPDKEYLEQLRQLMIRNGIVELLFTSDSPTMSGTIGTLPEYFFQTANFGGDPTLDFHKLQELQPNKPVMAMEYWAGWFDHYSEDHHTVSAIIVGGILDTILKYPASFNIYMFHGGTNYGFMNGANIGDGSTDNKGYQPTTTSYDYDAPLTEAGDYTVKYSVVKSMIEKYSTLELLTPQTPAETPRIKLQTLTNPLQLTINEAMDQIPKIYASTDVISMEDLNITENYGQDYGYIVYRKTNLNLDEFSSLKIEGRVCDTVMVLVNGQLVSPVLKTESDLDGFGYWRLKDSTLLLNENPIKNATLDLIVENWGRNNFGKISQFKQYKGLWQGGVFVNDQQVLNWDIFPISFKKTWNNNLNHWHAKNAQSTPSLYKFDIVINKTQDTYIDMRGWSKGIVIVNGFVLGRYSLIGPQQTLYFPAPFQKVGNNEIVVFEHFIPSDSLNFSKDPVFHTPSRNDSNKKNKKHQSNVMLNLFSTMMLSTVYY